MIMHLSNLAEPVHKIDNFIYLGNGFDAADYATLSTLGISAVVNATQELRCYFDDLEYMKVDVLDNGDAHIRPFFEEFIAFIDKHKGKNILIHCYMGSSRSAAFVLLYLVTQYQMTVDEALERIKNIRSIVNINNNFIEDLRTYIASLHQVEVSNIVD